MRGRPELETSHTVGMRVLLAILAVLAIAMLLAGIIAETVEFLFSVGVALLVLAGVVLLLRQLVSKR